MVRLSIWICGVAVVFYRPAVRFTVLVAGAYMWHEQRRGRLERNDMDNLIFTLEQQTARDVRAERKAALMKRAKHETLAVLAAGLRGHSGDLTPDLFDSLGGETPLFNDRRA